MARSSLLILEEDHASFVETLALLRTESNAKFAFLLDKTGQQIASVGELGDIDDTSLASLAAGSVAATEGLAELIGENVFSTLFHEGEKDSVHVSLVSESVILLVSFDASSSLGLVRLRVHQHTPRLAQIVDSVINRKESRSAVAAGATSSLSEITDEDIDALFG
jgi:predicted regulator of Ras-like GTPase activity (Roadblock/LC7/MglB family)